MRMGAKKNASQQGDRCLFSSSSSSPLDVFFGTDGALLVEISNALELSYEVVPLDAFRGDIGGPPIGHHPLHPRDGAIARPDILLRHEFLDGHLANYIYGGGRKREEEW